MNKRPVRRHPGHRCCPRWSGHQLECFGRHRRSSGLREVAAKTGPWSVVPANQRHGENRHDRNQHSRGAPPRLRGSDPRGDYYKPRDQTGIVAAARLHDLRHSHASHAIMNGESLHVTGRLLGHQRPSTTNRYAHLADATLSQAGECVALAVNRKLINNDQQESIVLQE